MLFLAFFLSGSAALLFETLWFRQAGLLLGNSVWASSLVLSAFMAGLCAGNVWAGRRAGQVRRPVLAYAGLEAVVGVTGFALVAGLPRLTSVFAGSLDALAPHPLLLNTARIAIAFVLLAVPSTAMGMTLPLLVRALSAREQSFGRSLGRLYGWNTLGAVSGALAGEFLLVPIMGLKAIGAVAATLNLLAGAVAVLAAPAPGGAEATTPLPDEAPVLSGARRSGVPRLLLAAFLSGAVFMALEVVWFRFLLLFLYGTSGTFAAMLASVLLGIALGGLCASAWLGSRWRSAASATLVAMLSGAAVVLTYATFAEALPPVPGIVADDARILRLSLTLMLPASWLSGMLFVFVGDALKSAVGDEVRAAAGLSFANTAGAAAGALAGGFWMIPYLGVERSLFALAVVYAVIAALALPDRIRVASPTFRIPGLAAAVLLLAALALFPFGLMRNAYLKHVASMWTKQGLRVVASREGLTESLLYLRQDQWGTPVSYRLVTNGFSMSGTGVRAERYMRLFVDWPRALHPEARSALLISFGVGTTATALTDTASLRSIDVVDISRDVLEMGRAIFAGRPYPLDDPRVQVHVEDGRFFLSTTRRRFDVITAEPPPPKYAGIGSLYSAEFFRLVAGRLAEGGVATYWLPVYQMTPRESRSVTAAFCAAFEDCSLWTGTGPEWMLVGTRNARGPVDEAAFTRSWREPATARALHDVGIEVPEQLGSLFLADGKELRAWIGDAPPLDDDHPGRLAHDFVELTRFNDEYAALMDTALTRRRFETSPFIRRLWPEALRARTLSRFAAQEKINLALWRYYGRDPGALLPPLEAALQEPDVVMPAMWIMGSDAHEQRALARALERGDQAPELHECAGIAAMAARDYRRAEELLSKAEPFAGHAARLRQWRILALSLAGDREAARKLLEASSRFTAAPGAGRADWEWLSQRLGMRP